MLGIINETIATLDVGEAKITLSRYCQEKANPPMLVRRIMQAEEEKPRLNDLKKALGSGKKPEL